MRDIYLCLAINWESWLDVCSLFNFEMEHTTTCLRCNHTNKSETTQMTMELQVPPDMSNLNNYLENSLNTCELVTKKCEESCRVEVQVEKRSKLKCGVSTKFFTDVMTRAISSSEGFDMIRNRVISTNELFIR